MTVKEKVIEMVKSRPDLIEEMLKKFCPFNFGIVNRFEDVERRACTKGCSKCWERTEEEVKRDEEIWKDYEKQDFNRTDYGKWLKKWQL